MFTSRTWSTARIWSTSTIWQWNTMCPSHTQHVSNLPFSSPHCGGNGGLGSWEWTGFDSSLLTSSEWTFSAQNSSLQELQAPLGRSFCCRNSSIVLSPTVHLNLLSLRLQAAQLPNTGHLGPCKTFYLFHYGNLPALSPEQSFYTLVVSTRLPMPPCLPL